MKESSEEIRRRIESERNEVINNICDNIAYNTGKGIIHAYEGREDEMTPDTREKYSNCKKDIEKKHGKKADPHVEAIFARMYGLI